MKKTDLDEATIAVMQRMLNTPPKRHEEMKIGRPAQKKRGAKGRVVSAKRRTASRTGGGS